MDGEAIYETISSLDALAFLELMLEKTLPGSRGLIPQRYRGGLPRGIIPEMASKGYVTMATTSCEAFSIS